MFFYARCLLLNIYDKYLNKQLKILVYDNEETYLILKINIYIMIIFKINI